MAECFSAFPTSIAEWDLGYDDEPVRWHRDRYKSLRSELVQTLADADVYDEATDEETERDFKKLAADWERAVSNISSLTAIVAHPKYREIVNMRWRVVPFLINDLHRNKRFWLPALEEITGIRPFDSGDSGNIKRMINAWVQWGRHKYKDKIR